MVYFLADISALPSVPDQRSPGGRIEVLDAKSDADGPGVLCAGPEAVNHAFPLFLERDIVLYQARHDQRQSRSQFSRMVKEGSSPVQLHLDLQTLSARSASKT